MSPNQEFTKYRAWLRMLLRMKPGIPKRIDQSDVVQEALLKAHARQGQFRGTTTGEYEAWLRRILANSLTDAYRADGRQPHNLEDMLRTALDDSSKRLEEIFVGADESPEQHHRRQERLQCLDGALEELPSDQREVVVMRHLQGQSVPEIAAATDRSIASVAGLLRRGLARLRELMDKRD